ncbi:CHAT domain-containing protein [Pleurocapsa sp. CCALA 161]|uniref:CHAT domain-containing protein n=1 Tax=Pleurocapsa sp. CCALA 161 TaxID=2107688 RepID=UPI000D04ED06|nr:CHAT domain-containing protein [Pleurocapsa sp. CCALA 161]PSB11466.1 CHAT domain-containing protein [Pleurocapsa sp. CCALA 161]
MKLSRLLIRVVLSCALIISSTEIARSQSGNMSDITQPNPNEIMNQPEPDEGNTADNLGENTAGDIVEETPVDSTQPNSEIETSSQETPSQETSDTINTQSEIVESEPVIIEQTTEAEAANSPESDEIVKKLVDEAEQRDIKKSEEPKEEKVAEKNSQPATEQIDRGEYETQFQDAPSDLAILMQEEFQLNQLIGSTGIQLYGSVPSVKQISHRLAQLAEQTGKKAAFINISLQNNQLESFVVLPEQVQANAETSLVASSELNGIDAPPAAQVPIIRKTVKNTSRKDIIAKATELREKIGDVRRLNQNEYKRSSQELYNVLIKPIEADLAANKIDVLVFSMDSGLRLLPVAALYDGKQFLIEKYAMGMVPSFGLTDTRYVSPAKASILAMGASEFKEQADLPTMPIELKTIVSNPRRGQSFLNQQFTIPNFVAQNSGQTPFSIIHLGTHAEFKAGDLSDSYIQFYDSQLKIPQLQKLSNQLGWNTNKTPIELMVLSACETALGDKDAELGFAGLAVQAGVKSTLASLWYVSDLGTLAMMGEFYDQLDSTLNKAEALRQTQLAMLRGNVKINNKQVNLSNGTGLPLPSDFPDGTLTLNHPYFWSSFTLVGNWN